MDKPECFGKEWSVSATECTGGYDGGYKDPKTGSSIRERCRCFDECGKVSREARATAYAQPQYRPYTSTATQTDTRMHLPQVPQPIAVRVGGQPSAPQPAPGTAPYQGAAGVPGTPQFGGQLPMVVPQVEMMPRNWFAVPQVLAVHEPRQERPLASFCTEVLRGMGMITGLVTADFMSNVPLLGKRKEDK